MTTETTNVVSSEVAILVIVGASGAGKTTVLQELRQRRLPSVGCYNFDSIGVPSSEVMQREFGGPERWQAAMTDQWIGRLAANQDGVDVAVLEGQTRPSFLETAFMRCGVQRADIVLLDCSPEVRNARLHGPRAQSELATPRMDSWAVYLRGQADALGLTVYDTASLEPAGVADALTKHIETLRGLRQSPPQA
jgi:GTPase SAR1 family protein